MSEAEHGPPIAEGGASLRQQALTRASRVSLGQRDDVVVIQHVEFEPSSVSLPFLNDAPGSPGQPPVAYVNAAVDHLPRANPLAIPHDEHAGAVRPAACEHGARVFQARASAFQLREHLAPARFAIRAA